LPTRARTPPSTQELVAELTAFPGGSNDDQVDAFTQALNYLRRHHGFRLRFLS